jgi:hypothetical protein
MNDGTQLSMRERDMSPRTRQQEAIATPGLLAIGVLLLVIAIFLDPIGSSPDSGMFYLGPTATRWLLGLLGGAFLLAGLRACFKSGSTRSK